MSAPEFDLVIKGARVVDGTGLPAYVSDVGVKGDRIAKIGRIDSAAIRTIDGDGLVLTPGFIDIHTHYDVQLDWDPIVTPSCWHGITTVLAGNCGFTLAPAKPEDVDWLAGMLSRVEGMSRAALAEGLKFTGGGHGDYWGRFEGKVGVNVASYVGHCAVRRYVMGDDASEREATPEEIGQMKELVREAMREGAIGFSTSQLDLHVGEDGREVPSNHASADEVVALAGVLSEFDRGAVEIIPRSFGRGYDDADRELMVRIHEASGRPVELNLLFPSGEDPESWSKSLAWCKEQNEKGGRFHPQFATNRGGIHMKLSDTFVFDDMKKWREVLCLAEPERSERLRDPAARAELGQEFEAEAATTIGMSWGNLAVEQVADPANQEKVGKTIAELAAAEGKDGVDVFLDLALSEGLETWFNMVTVPEAAAYMDQICAQVMREPFAMAGSSDGGAHLASFVGADYTTNLLTDFVPDVLSLEEAVFKLAYMPAVVHGIRDRGAIREGYYADLVLIDMDALAKGETWLAKDFPAESERFVVDSRGYVATIVNGEVVLEQNKHTGALPGHVLR
ncbi:MAG: aminoacylase [Deltaproteobacteria bacterium]|nr:aminoacylase [Deltaproteobacteria bacterium]